MATGVGPSPSPLHHKARGHPMQLQCPESATESKPRDLTTRRFNSISGVWHSDPQPGLGANPQSTISGHLVHSDPSSTSPTLASPLSPLPSPSTAAPSKQHVHRTFTTRTGDLHIMLTLPPNCTPMPRAILPDSAEPSTHRVSVSASTSALPCSLTILCSTVYVTPRVLPPLHPPHDLPASYPLVARASSPPPRHLPPSPNSPTRSTTSCSSATR